MPVPLPESSGRLLLDLGKQVPARHRLLYAVHPIQLDIAPFKSKVAGQTIAPKKLSEEVLLSQMLDESLCPIVARSLKLYFAVNCTH